MNQPEFLYVGRYSWQPVDSIHDSVRLHKLTAAAQDQRNWGEQWQSQIHEWAITREQHAKCSVQFVNAEYLHYYLMYFVVMFHIWHSISLHMFGWRIYVIICFYEVLMRKNSCGWNVMSTQNIRSTRGEIKEIFVVLKYTHKNTLLFYQINEDIYPCLHTFC